MANRKLRIGLIGAGGISETHCHGWSKLADCELVAITDMNAQAAQKRAQDFKIPSVESSAKTLVARKDIDVVDVVVPNFFHKEFSIAAMNAGKHVLCEKPLALTRKEVLAMIAASEKTGKKLMAAQHMRFQQETEAMKAYITSNPLGDVYYGRAWYNRRRQLPCRPGFMYMKNSGGGCCIDVGVHVLDTALHLMNNFEPVSVTGVSLTKLARRPDAWSEWGTIDKENLDVEDFAAGFIRFANGAALSLECSFMLNQKSKYTSRIDLFGSEAGIAWPECEVYSTSASKCFVDSKIEFLPGEAPHHKVISAFAESVMGDTEVPVPPSQSLAVISILEGLYKSQKTGSEVVLAKA
ncbi:MAG: Gfo/Idh/MocA family oxidoreductase, partial [Planctomycetes bacterium]|nr:Gfo/Idh/MocA family oxidoreductase [Planctomycetota bacterium]